MEQRELSKKDAEGKDLSVIVLILHLKDAGNLVQEMRILKGILVEWHRARQKAAYQWISSHWLIQSITRRLKISRSLVIR